MNEVAQAIMDLQAALQLIGASGDFMVTIPSRDERVLTYKYSYAGAYDDPKIRDEQFVICGHKIVIRDDTPRTLP